MSSFQDFSPPIHLQALPSRDPTHDEPRLAKVSVAPPHMTIVLAQVATKTVSPPSRPFLSTLLALLPHSPGSNRHPSLPSAVLKSLRPSRSQFAGVLDHGPDIHDVQYKHLGGSLPVLSVESERGQPVPS